MDPTTLTLLLIVLGVIVGGWLLYLAAAALIIFARFVGELHPLLAVLMFFLFPPSLLAFLVGYALMRWGWKRAPS